MRLTLRQLQAFLAVSESGSTAAAAGLIALSQSATSASLNELEAMLDVRLFDRVGKRLLINDNGRILLPQAKQILDGVNAIEQQFAADNASSAIGLHIGASTTIGTYLLPKILAAGAAKYGWTNSRVMIANTADIAAAVDNFKVDVGLIEGPCHEPDLQVEPWLSDELIVVCARTHALAISGRKVPLKALREAGWLLREPGSGTREAVEAALLPHLHHLRSAGEFSNSEAIKYAAAAGLGLACMSRLVVADLVEMGQLVELDTTLPALQRNLYLIYRKHKMLAARLHAFLAFCRGAQPGQ
jgi:DNA-binding transcriptional LysR family regulator